MKIASMHAPIKIGTSIYAINLYERLSLLSNVYVLLIFINEREYMILVIFIVSVKKVILLYRFNGYFLFNVFNILIYIIILLEL